MKKAVAAVLAVVAVSFALAVTVGNAGDEEFVELGYFKDDRPRRAFLYGIDDTIGIEAVRAHAEGAMHTGGQVTTVGYTRAGCADNGCRTDVTLAPGFDAAVEEMRAGGLVFIAWRLPSGQLNLFDCATEPDAC